MSTDRTFAPVPQTATVGRLDAEWLSRIPVGRWGLDAAPYVDFMDDHRTEGEKAAQWTAARLHDFSVVIAWHGEFGISLGVVRGRYPEGYAGRTEDTFEASPFPGGWEEVPLSKIVAVRASSTL